MSVPNLALPGMSKEEKTGSISFVATKKK